MNDFGKLLETAGIPMYLNVIVFIVVIAVIIERTIFYVMHGRMNIDKFTSHLIKLMENNQLEQAIKYSTIDHAVCKVFNAGVKRADNNPMEISMAMNAEQMKVTTQLEKRISSLWALANIATLLGLIGTVFGLITSFGSMRDIPPEKKTEILSAGISEALWNTAIGLTIAVICMTGHFFLSTASKKLVAELEHSAVNLENFLILRSKKLREEKEVAGR